MSASFQTNYNQNMPIGILGRIADCGFKNTLSPQSLEPILAGVGVLKPFNLDYKIMLPRNNTASSAFSGDLILANVINATVNGVAITPVTFATSHLATMQAIANAISAIATVQSAVVGGLNNRTITIISDIGTATVVTSFVVTLGASQATIVTTASQGGTFFGVTQEIYGKGGMCVYPLGANLTSSDSNQIPYYKGEVVPTLTQGRIYVQPETLVTSNSGVFLRVALNGPTTALGNFRGDADGGTAVLIPTTQAVWREGNSAIDDLAVLEINLP